MKPVTGERAFPIDVDMQDGSGFWNEGMTLRDYFAAKALPLAWDQEQVAPTGTYSDHMEPTYMGAATRAYYMADAMLKARQE